MDQPPYPQTPAAGWGSTVNPSTMLFAGSGAAVIIGMIWPYFRMIYGYLISFILVTVELRSDEYIPTRMVQSFIAGQCYLPNVGPKVVFFSNKFVQTTQRSQAVGYVSIPSTLIAFYHKRPLLFKTSGDKSGDKSTSSYTVTFIRGTFNAMVLVKEINKYFNSKDVEEKGGRYRYLTFTGGIGQGAEPGNNKLAKPSSDMDNYGMSPITHDKSVIGEVKEKVEMLTRLALADNVQAAIRDATKWKSAEKWYKERNISWRRGLLLYGKPGCGKSSVVKALAQKLDMPVVAFDLSSMSNSDFTRMWRDLSSFAPCVALFEDFDNVFDGRKNLHTTTTSVGLTFDTFLNALSGVGTVHGILTVITTNDLSKIDPALGQPNAQGDISRPGRIDAILELGIPTREGRRLIVERILGTGFEQLITETEGSSGAQVEEKCIKLALERFWNS